MKKTLLYKTSLVLIYLLGLSTFYSPFRALSFFNETWAFLTIFWIIVVMLDNPIYFLRGNYQFLLIIYLFYTIFVPFLTGNVSLGFRFFELGQIPIFIMASAYYKKKHKNKDLIKIIYAYVPFIIITGVLTLKANALNPITSRLVKESSDSGIRLLQMGIGGYHFIYFIVILMSIVSFLFHRDYTGGKKLKRILLIGFTVLLFFNILLSNYSTALLLMILSIFMSLIFTKIQSKRLFSNILLLLILFLLFFIIIIPVLNYSIEFLGDTLNSSRLKEIQLFITSDYLGDSIYARFEAYIKSLEAFINSPILGVIFTNLKYGESSVTGFGQHSQILDVFALFGIFIGVLQLFLFFKPLTTIYNNTTEKTFIFTILIVFLLMILFNNLTPSIGFAVFFIFPALHDSVFSIKNSN